MAKGLTSGYAPLGAVAMKQEIASTFDNKVYEGGLTYNGHPISLAAAVANIEVMQEQNLVGNAHAMGNVMSEMLAELVERHPSVGEVRSIGLFGILDLVKNRKTREPMAPFGKNSPEMLALKNRLSEKGLFVYTHWNTLLLLPPLIINTEQLSEGFKIIDDALQITDQAVK
jgi:taurine--2-oxoglutarate transaminase